MMKDVRDSRRSSAHGLRRGSVAAAAQADARSRPEPARSCENPPSGRELTARSADETRLHVEVFGPEDGQTVVLVHGWTENASFWTYVIRELANRGFRVVVPELRGHGRSGAAAERDYALGRFGDDVEAVLGQCVPDGEPGGDRRALARSDGDRRVG